MKSIIISLLWSHTLLYWMDLLTCTAKSTGHLDYSELNTVSLIRSLIWITKAEFWSYLLILSGKAVGGRKISSGLLMTASDVLHMPLVDRFAAPALVTEKKPDGTAASLSEC